ncbi:RDD family protein [Streptomyces sp. GSL17-111]|uniref:RDD family protein n=1 Tax=Streptomyces sp. GSL17-111 TaxID=3121596 RepID=UPI0030F477E3
MSTDQPRPGGEPPEEDPFRKPPQAPPPPGSGVPHDQGPPPGGPYGQGPSGQEPPAQGPYGGQGGQGQYGGQGGPGGYGEYGYGPPSPLAGMPPLASRGKRLLARIIDWLVVAVPVLIVTGLLFNTWVIDTDGSETAYDGSDFAQTIIYTLVYFLYEGLMLTTRGQTLGKMAMRIRVAMLDDGALPAGNPGWFRAAVYSLPTVVPCLGFLFWLVNVLWCTWDQPYHQCLHDKAAKTVVVRA